MLYFVTGLPGASKTLNTIKMVCEEQEFKNRPVYYNRIDDVTIDDWQELPDNDVAKWFDLPHGSVIIIDEAYRHFPVMKRGETKPEHYEKLAEIRHYGITMICICQAATDVDTFVRKKAGRHYHYERHYGTRAVKQIQFKLTSGAITDTDRNSNRDMAEIKTLKIDAAYFGKYKSAEVHTVKANLPWKRFAFPVVALVLVIACTAYFLSHFGKTGNETEAAQAKPVQQVPVKTITSEILQSQKPEGLQLSDYQPRVPNMPWTAPIYDKLMTDVKSVPLPKACAYSKSRNTCRCVTDQATYIDVGYALCKSIVKNGFFDTTKEPTKSSQPTKASPSDEWRGFAEANRAPALVIGANSYPEGPVVRM
ncbi:hypothetical protein E6Q11_05045 [Candidatus Dojkabacteria bacterium]|uniref:Zona occludens toxin N-terminal domain-containing protein n=1 Tax=Candidatus Dojkabacteria bacterium TaxID=2099670 RepID=A0A5C7J430_9BACT|nr:MAG: hypothetical protein E6Q11_05045 [Candidatus Dojkabacteria bacterium]